MNQRSILISDDDPQLVAALTRLALAGGFAVIPDLESNVVMLAQQHRPTLILLDVEQAVDGRVLLGALRRTPSLESTPIVMLSGHNHPVLKQFCLALGANAFQSKPFDGGFLRAIGEWMGLIGSGVKAA